MHLIHSAPEFSLYSLIDSHSVHNIFTHSPRTLAHWSAMIERELVSRRVANIAYVGLQWARNLMPILPRYRTLAQAMYGVWLFAQPDETHIVNDPFYWVDLDYRASLAREWFLVSPDRHYSVALVAREVSSPAAPPAERRYTGVFTTDRYLVSELALALAQQVRRAGVCADS